MSELPATGTVGIWMIGIERELYGVHRAKLFVPPTWQVWQRMYVLVTLLTYPFHDDAGWRRL